MLKREIKLQCPLCMREALAYNPQKQLGHCFICQKGYNDITIERLLGYVPGGDFVAEVEPEPEKLVPDTLYMQEALHDSMAGWALLDDRGCWVHDLYHVLYDQQSQRLWFPIHPIGGEPGPCSTRNKLTVVSDSIRQKSWITRSVFRSRKGWRRIGPDVQDGVYGVLRPHTPYIILVEGIWDVLTPRLTGSALSLLGTNLTERQESWLSLQDKPVLIWMDEDKAGRLATGKLWKKLKGMLDVRCVFYHKEPGDCSPEEARWVLANCLQEVWFE